MVHDFRRLRVWEEAMVLAERVYELTRALPADERFGLVTQLRRASVSVPSCIAEGNARRSIADYLRFLGMARGSLAELETQTLLSVRLGLVQPDAIEAVMRQVRQVARLLQALCRVLSSKLA